MKCVFTLICLQTIDCGLLLKSIGYKAVPFPGLSFDEQKSCVINDKGRIVPGLYCSGWLKRGPTGIIASNIIDARETTKCVVEDLDAGLLPQTPNTSLADLLKEHSSKIVSWDQFCRIDEEEIKRGSQIGKPREKITSIEEMLAIAGISL